MTQFDHRAAWVALSLALGPRSNRLKPLLARFGTPEGILDADEAALLEAMPDLGKGFLSRLKVDRQRSEVSRILTYCDRTGVTVLTPDGEGYPASLFAIDEPPAVLYCRGTLPRPGTAPFVGVVGMRDLDAYGERAAYKLSFELAAAGAVVVSGLAEGIDGIAAAAAVDAGTPTVAVLGCGIDRVYPKHHTRLAKEVVACGAVVTEFAPGTPPNGWNFPVRNRIISALSEAVVVVEADEKSGALITARYALLQGKTLFAVPGNIDNPRAVGCNNLLRAGAVMALSAEDILAQFRFLYRDSKEMHVPVEAMQYAGVSAEKLRAHGIVSVGEEKGTGKAPAPKSKTQKSKASAPGAEGQAQTENVAAALATLNERQRQIYEMLGDAPFSIDHLAAQGIAAPEAVSAMTLFEILGLVTSHPGAMYRKRSS